MLSCEDYVVDDGVGAGGPEMSLTGVRWGRCVRESTVQDEEGVVVS